MTANRSPACASKLLYRPALLPDALVAQHAYFGTSARFTQSVHSQFESVVRNAFRDFIRDRVQERLRSALAGTASSSLSTQPAQDDTEQAETEDDVVTTAAELEAFFIVKSILRQQIESERIVARDVRSYFGILLDDNNRKPLARLHFGSATKYLGLFDNPNKKEDRVALKSLDDIYTYRDRLLATPSFYEGRSAPPADSEEGSRVRPQRARPHPRLLPTDPAEDRLIPTAFRHALR